MLADLGTESKWSNPRSSQLFISILPARLDRHISNMSSHELYNAQFQEKDEAPNTLGCDIYKIEARAIPPASEPSTGRDNITINWIPQSIPRQPCIGKRKVPPLPALHTYVHVVNTYLAPPNAAYTCAPIRSRLSSSFSRSSLANSDSRARAHAAVRPSSHSVFFAVSPLTPYSPLHASSRPCPYPYS
jgi:hypothetical protein